MNYMKKELKDYLPLYLGCKVKTPDTIGINLGLYYPQEFASTKQLKPNGVNVYYPEHKTIYAQNFNQVKPILRKLSDINEEEAEKIVLILFSDVEDKIYPDEIQMSLVKGDGGNLVDADIDLIIEVSCRCFEGQIAIRKCGSISLFDEEGELQRSANHSDIFRYMLSKHFDLFGLIESNLALDALEIYGLKQ